MSKTAVTKDFPIINEKNALVFRDQIVDSLHSAISSGAHGLSSVPGLLRRAIMEEVWQERTVRSTGETIPAFKSFRAFVETVPPDGLGTNLELIEKIIRDDPEALEMFRAVTTGHHGGDRRSPSPSKSDNVTLEPKRGNRRSYILSRLKRSRPDLFDKVVAGKMTANAAAIEAGFKKQLTPFEQCAKLWPKLTPAEMCKLNGINNNVAEAVAAELRAMEQEAATVEAEAKRLEAEGHIIVDGGSIDAERWEFTDWRTGNVLAAGSAEDKHVWPWNWYHCDRIDDDVLDYSRTIDSIQIDGLPDLSGIIAVTIREWVENNEEAAREWISTRC